MDLRSRLRIAVEGLWRVRAKDKISKLEAYELSVAKFEFWLHTPFFPITSKSLT
jgi:hypothetical protein